MINDQKLLGEASALGIIAFAEANALRDTLLVNDELKKIYDENYQKQLTKLAEQIPSLSQALERMRSQSQS